MRVELDVLGFAVSGGGAEALPTRRVVPPPTAARPTRGGGRLSRLALALAERASADLPDAADAGVLVGTDLGCLTETERFVAHMIREREATPKPRAFSSSVHNAVASYVAMKLGARGDCQTFVHGEVAFAQALFAAGAAAARAPSTRLYVGAVDEAPVDTFLELARAAGAPPPEAGAEGAEGGAMLVAAHPSATDATPLARLSSVSLGRGSDPIAWARAELEGTFPEAILFTSPLRGARLDERATTGAGAAVVGFRAHHGSSLATATALAVALLAEEAAPAIAGLAQRPRCVAVLGASARGDAALLVLRQGDEARERA